jgi:ubiquinone/menaquinone biosynthesis C-methylase UbiE
MSTDTPETSRVTRSRELARASYDRMSRWYDWLAGSGEKKITDAGLQKLGVREGETVLEIGFGTGHSMLALAQAVGGLGRVYGIDISEGMLNVAQARINQAGLSARAKLMCGDAAQLSFRANCFDAVFMSFTLELFDTPDIAVVLRGCQRVLRNGGRIGVVSLSKKNAAGLMPRLYEWAHARFPNYVDCRPIFARNAVEEAGFDITSITDTSTWGLPIEIVTASKRAWGAAG